MTIAFIRVIDEEGSNIHILPVAIPSETMAGPYHFIVQAIDTEGNSTSFQDGSAIELEIYITNDSQPVVYITNLEGDELEIEAGKIFMVEREVQIRPMESMKVFIAWRSY